MLRTVVVALFCFSASVAGTVPLWTVMLGFASGLALYILWPKARFPAESSTMHRGSAIIGPLINIVNQFKITPLLGMSDNSYIFYIFYGMLLIFEIMAIIAFGYIVMRRQVSGTEYL